jgi:hypothetical protein
MGVNGRQVALRKAAYAVVFLIALPVLFMWWASATADIVPLPVVPYSWFGSVVATIGLLLMLAATFALWVFGRGLPMSPYPPPTYVSTAVYRFTPHPIYLGFVLLCLGLAIFTQSASGTWLVTPCVTLACAALVLGFERHEIRARFGAATIRKPQICLPPSSSSNPTGWDRISVFVLVFLPWTVAFEAVYRLGVPPDAVEAFLPFERNLPVLEWTEAIYGSVYFLVVAAPFVARTQAALRHMAVTALITTAVVVFIYLTVPLVAPPRPFEPSTVLGRALEMERAMSHTVAAFPAFHVIWSLIAAEAWASRSKLVGAVAWIWAIAIALSCVTTGMHAVVDIVAAGVTYGVLRRYRFIWQILLRQTERIANSWMEWRVGRLRVINHGIYAAIAGAVGFLIAATFAGPGVFEELVIVHLAGLAGAGLWAQKLEGSSKLARPFGYFGSVLGGLAAAITVGTFTGNTMLLLAAIALEAPWMQAIGRGRCLVQGCCHGKATTEESGIRYKHPRSRVCDLADLEGEPIHPTPLYSILANVVVGLFLLRLWSLGASLSLVAGLYLILSGVARFVEESYRGEPQTALVAGLRLYQWLAIISFAAGIVIMALPSGVTPGLSISLDARMLFAALSFGAVTGFAMGVDFPGSARRFARLAPP